MPLKPFIITWTTALRSGTFKQGDGKLFIKEENSYCCLGVRCAIEDPNGFFEGGLMWRNVNHRLADAGICYIPKTLGVPEEAQVVLADMNDVQSKTFPEIADWIEQQPWAQS